MSYSIKKRTITLTLLVFSYVFLAIVYNPTYAKACSCAPPPSVKEEFSKSDAVFSGKVISVKENRALNGRISKNVIFEVSQTWKGVKETQIKIVTGQGGGDCGFNFIEGKEYLVYSNKSDMYGKQQLITIMCDRTVELSVANEDVKALGEGKPPIKEVDVVKADRKTNAFFFLIGVFIISLIGFFSWKKFKRSK